MKRWFIFWLLGSIACSLPAQSIEETHTWSGQQLEKARQELSDARDKIVEEKLPLARQLREIKQTLLEKQNQKRLLDEQKSGGETELSQLRTRSKETGELAAYFENQAVRFRQSFEEDLVPGERDVYEEAFLKLDQLHRDQASPMERAQAQWEILEKALNRLDGLPGGSRFKTEAINAESVSVPGTAVQYGPVVLFQADDRSASGNLVTGLSLTPEILSVDETHASAMDSFFKQGKAMVPFDPTLGKATLIHEGHVSLTQHLARGGFWMIPIGIFGLCAFLISLVKWLHLRSVRLPAWSDLQGPVGDTDSARTARFGGVPDKLRVALTPAATTQPTESRMAELDLAYQEFKFQLNRWLPVISLTAGVSPLLGLLGTVTGMIKTFQLISIFGAGDAQLLSSGISEALITTEYGLVVAIPALIMHAYLSRRVKKLLAQAAHLFEHASRKVAA